MHSFIIAASIPFATLGSSRALHASPAWVRDSNFRLRLAERDSGSGSQPAHGQRRRWRRWRPLAICATPPKITKPNETSGGNNNQLTRTHNLKHRSAVEDRNSSGLSFCGKASGWFWGREMGGRAGMEWKDRECSLSIAPNLRWVN